MSPVGQPIIEGHILLDTAPPSIGLPPPTRRTTGSSNPIINRPSIPALSSPTPPGSASTTPSGAHRTSHIAPPGTPPLVDDSEMNSPIEEAAPSTPPAGLNRTSVPEYFGQKNDPPSYITARFQHDVTTLRADVEVLEQKVNLYSAQSQAELAAGTAAIGKSLGKMILDSEARVSADVGRVREEVSVKFNLIFQVMSELAKDAEKRRLSGGAVVDSQGLPGNRSVVLVVTGQGSV